MYVKDSNVQKAKYDKKTILEIQVVRKVMETKHSVQAFT